MDPAFQDMDFIDILRIEEEEHTRLMPLLLPHLLLAEDNLPQLHPLHRIESVPDFKGITLAMMGLVVFLGTPRQQNAPRAFHDADFTILYVDGPHNVIVDFAVATRSQAIGRSLKPCVCTGGGVTTPHWTLRWRGYREDLGLILGKPEKKRTCKKMRRA
ncbi:hypothetical protein C8F04DRAFT_1272824 [Mycena alexandri]|uniref:Uncharacterized protein n=1 Tax=Mycena alexandri TaxID=1745969 RepID=A0AAD6S8F2_9AGAR|nr:hypothetical protein C8F04DRAFT_1272824 [Mycena alexandri]